MIYNDRILNYVKSKTFLGHAHWCPFFEVQMSVEIFIELYTPGGGGTCSIHDKFAPSVFFGVKSSVTYFFRS